jgi:hypothetical protein
MKTLMKSILTAAVLSVSMEPGLFIRAHTLFFWQPEVALRKDGRVRSPSGPLTLVASNSQPHRKTGRLGDATLPSRSMEMALEQRVFVPKKDGRLSRNCFVRLVDLTWHSKMTSTTEDLLTW